MLEMKLETVAVNCDKSPTTKNMFLYEFIIYVDCSCPVNLINEAAVFDICTVFKFRRLDYSYFILLLMLFIHNKNVKMISQQNTTDVKIFFGIMQQMLIIVFKSLCVVYYRNIINNHTVYKQSTA